MPAPDARRSAFLRVLPLFAIAILLSAPTAFGAPAWTLENPAGRRVAFADELARGPVVVSFWATWCKPCLKELPHLEELAERYDGRVTFLAVCTDDSRSVAKVEPLVRARGWSHLKVLLDTAAAVQQALQVDAMPYLIVYDREGREAYRHAGYVEGGEVELEQAILQVLAPAAPLAATSGEPAAGELTATDRFEYSYATGTRREIVENWLDVSWRQGAVRAGLTLNSQAPAEEIGRRRNEITHRWFEFTRGEATLRAGTFHGLFGRGLIFNAWQDRNLRIDTRLDGITASIRHGNLAATALSGTPSFQAIDVRAVDLEWTAGPGPTCGFSGLTWQDPDAAATGPVRRDWAAGLRARQSLPHADWYLEVAGRNRFSLAAFDFDPAADDPREGWALYGNLNLYAGPVTVSWEGSDYQDFELVSRADGITALNRPPALSRDFTWTLLNRAPHTLNANDEKGHNLDLSWRGPAGWAVEAGGARLRLHDGSTVYESAYLSAARDRWGDFGLVGAFGYQESEGLRQTVATEVSWRGWTRGTWTLQAEHQHVRVGGGVGFDYGAYDQQWFKLEYAAAARWIVAGVVETNNKYDAQRERDEVAGPFLAGQLTRTLDGGAALNLWAGERQAGFLCSGGVCKFEPAFTGIEFFGTLRW